MFFYSSRVASRGPGFDLPPKKKSAENRGDFSPRSRGFFSAIAGIFLRDRGEFSPRSRRFFSAIAGIFLRDRGDFSPRLRRKIPAILLETLQVKVCLPGMGSESVSTVRTATLVLHEVRTRCLSPCDCRHPVGLRDHFWTQSSERECARLRTD
jgi:hypothetical protein